MAIAISWLVVISTNQFKNGTHIEVDGVVFKVVDFQHVKPGKGGAFVRTKLKRLSDGAAIDRTFRAGEKFRPIRTETRKMQYLYSDGTDAHFMDSQTYEQLPIPEDQLKDSLKWVVDNQEVDVLYVDEQPSEALLQLRADVVVRLQQRAGDEQQIEEVELAGARLQLLVGAHHALQLTEEK